MEGVGRPAAPDDVAACPADPSVEVEVEVDRAGDELVVRVRGELDLTNAGTLADTIEAALDDASLDCLVFELAGLSFMDSSGLAVMLHTASQVGRVRLRGASPLIREVVAATGLTEILVLE